MKTDFSIKNLKRKIIDISYAHKACHIGSCLTSIDLLNQIYQIKKPYEPFILSNGHAGLALYVILEKFEGKNAEALFLKHGTHPNYDKANGIWCSTGSLGHGIGIAVGMAYANTKRKVFCMVSDGECTEGSFWESIRIASEYKLKKLHIFVNANGFGGLETINSNYLEKRIRSFIKDDCPKVHLYKTSCNLPHLEGIKGHYTILTRKQYNDVIQCL